jgi:hypothetical protein
MRPLSELKKLRTENAVLKTKLALCSGSSSPAEASTAGAENSEDLQAAKSKIAELTSRLQLLEDTLKKAQTPGETVPAGEMAKQTTPYFCTPEVSDHQAWRKESERKMRDKEHFGPDAMQGKWSGLSIPPTYWCDKLHNNLKPWVRPGITTDDVVVGIYTGESLFYSRASTTRDTWVGAS